MIDVDLDEVRMTATVNDTELDCIGRAGSVNSREYSFLFEQARAAQRLRRTVAAILGSVRPNKKDPAMAAAWKKAELDLRALGHPSINTGKV